MVSNSHAESVLSSVTLSFLNGGQNQPGRNNSNRSETCQKSESTRFKEAVTVYINKDRDFVAVIRFLCGSFPTMVSLRTIRNRAVDHVDAGTNVKHD